MRLSDQTPLFQAAGTLDALHGNAFRKNDAKFHHQPKPPPDACQRLKFTRFAHERGSGKLADSGWLAVRCRAFRAPRERIRARVAIDHCEFGGETAILGPAMEEETGRLEVESEGVVAVKGKL